MSAVTAEELAAAGPCAVSLTSIAPYHAKAARFGGAAFEFHARAQTTVERAAALLPRLARDLTAERDTSKRLADRCLDLGRELEALRAAVQEHEADTRGPGMLSRAWNQADLDLWAAAKT